jgi:hypothetical protein
MAQRMAWDRVSEWELEEGPGCVVLTLRGGGSVTPLMVKGWSLDDLEAVMRQATAGTTGPAAEVETAADVPVPEATVAGPDAGSPRRRSAPALSRAARRQAARWRRLTWKAIVTVLLLGVLAAAVAVVLLQSAGIISWGFLGPTA